MLEIAFKNELNTCATDPSKEGGDNSKIAYSPIFSSTQVNFYVLSINETVVFNKNSSIPKYIDSPRHIPFSNIREKHFSNYSSLLSIHGTGQ